MIALSARGAQLLRACGAVTLLLCLALSGCIPGPDSMMDEEKDPNFLSGRSKVSSMDYTGALESFGRALEANPRSASAHKELGWLHYQKFNDYAAAIYHFQQLLKLRPKDPQAEFIRKNIEACKQELARSVFLDPVNEKTRKAFEALNTENLRLKTENTNLASQVQWLRQQLADRAAAPAPFAPRADAGSAPSRDLHPVPPPAPGPSSAPAQGPGSSSRFRASPTPPMPPSGARLQDKPDALARKEPPRRPALASTPTPTPSSSTRLHAVRAGESLYSVSKRYGVSVSALVGANPGVNARKLRAGQTLTIPSR